jgi:hypothetical protein
VKEPDLSGVVKIQNGDFNNLTEVEIEAVSMLRVDNSGSHAGAGSHPARDPHYLSTSSYASAVQSKRQRVQTLGQDSYVNCDYILGSAAEVERLWSLASYVCVARPP